jgi:hypothetical protein
MHLLLSRLIETCMTFFQNFLIFAAQRSLSLSLSLSLSVPSPQLLLYYIEGRRYVTYAVYVKLINRMSDGFVIKEIH